LKPCKKSTHHIPQKTNQISFNQSSRFPRWPAKLRQKAISTAKNPFSILTASRNNPTT